MQTLLDTLKWLSERHEEKHVEGDIQILPDENIQQLIKQGTYYKERRLKYVIYCCDRAVT